MSTEALLLDYLFAGELIQARLRTQVASLSQPGGVEGVETFAQAIDRNVQAPTAFVLWEGDVIDTSPQGRTVNSQIFGQQWTAILVVRNAAQSDQVARNESAGPLLSAIHKAIAGWRPPGAVRPFTRAQGRKATYTGNVGIYPLTFELPLYL